MEDNSAGIHILCHEYLAHAATVNSTLGDTTTIASCNMIFAIVSPMSGLMRALNAIAQQARFGSSE